MLQKRGGKINFAEHYIGGGLFRRRKQMKLKAILDARSDYIGIISATICLIHCIIVPIIFAYYVHDHSSHSHSFGSGVEGSHGHHHLGSFGFFKVDFIFLAIGLVAIIFSSRHTSSKWIRFMMWTSYVILVCSVLMEEVNIFFQVTLYAASVGLILAHVFNLKHLRLHLQGKEHSH